ncbi:MAG: AMP-binding protein, partial [Cyanobacteria bacterium]|nr:AMP-binding protein [Cyanobacteriota bacterium]
MTQISSQNVSPVVEGVGYPTIHKGRLDALSLKELPQMKNYDALTQNFSWDAIYQELRLPRANGYNKATICIDDHPESVMNRPALYWKSGQGKKEVFTFSDLKCLTNQFANVLQSLGVKKGDRVFIYLGRVPEIFITLFGALKVGAVVGPLFSAFGPEAIKDRLLDSGA